MMPTGYPRDLTGQKFNRLTVLEIHSCATHTAKRTWRCLCDCGKEAIVVGTQLTLGKTKSCGCYNIESVVKRSTVHGMACRNKMNRAYIPWCSMKTRCLNSNDPKRWKDYGGRGVVVCERWSASFADFLDDIGERPAGRWSVDRLRVNGGYTCGKCQQCIANNWPMNARWADDTAQARNKRNIRHLTVDGKSMCAAAWADHTGLSERLIVARKSRGWADERAVTTPRRIQRKSKSISEGCEGRQRFLTSEYIAWTNAKSRCLSNGNYAYDNYGGRGITMCNNWRDWGVGFKNFLADIGPRPTPKHSLDRIDVDGNYSCGRCAQCVASGWTANCRWATAKEQAGNKRHNKHLKP